MDRSIREMGVGDTGVSKRIKNMASALLGRMTVYEQALGNNATMAEALLRNVFREQEGEEAKASRLALYVAASVNALAAQQIADIVNGDIHFVS
jgi:cytochrome b pre-mRNA-processing protein 3